MSDLNSGRPEFKYQEVIETWRKSNNPPETKEITISVAAILLAPIAPELPGAASLNDIAAKLNERNVPTARGGRWTHVQVGAVLRPFAEGAASIGV